MDDGASGRMNTGQKVGDGACVSIDYRYYGCAMSNVQLVFFTLLLVIVSLANAVYLFTRFRTYDMQLRSVSPYSPERQWRLISRLSIHLHLLTPRRSPLRNARHKIRSSRQSRKRRLLLKRSFGSRGELPSLWSAV